MPSFIDILVGLGKAIAASSGFIAATARTQRHSLKWVLRHSPMAILPRSTVWLGLILGLAIATSLLEAFTRSGEATEIADLDWSKAETITVRMEEYRFIPDHLTLRRGIPYRLHLVNVGNEMHELTAPDLFRSLLLKNPEIIAPYGNQVVLQPHEETDVLFVAQQSGLFSPTCADHDWAGMKATIIVD